MIGIKLIAIGIILWIVSFGIIAYDDINDLKPNTISINNVDISTRKLFAAAGLVLIIVGVMVL